jgi:hypothetical protein
MLLLLELGVRQRAILAQLNKLLQLSDRIWLAGNGPLGMHNANA